MRNLPSPPFPNLNSDPTMIENNDNPRDPEWHQYPGPHPRKPEETQSKRRRARRVDRSEEVVEEQDRERLVL